MIEKKKIGIIGAGIAGITAAVELLTQDAVDITIFDAKSSIGGRISSYFDPIMNETIDNGKHLMVGAYHHFFELLRKLDTLDKLNFQQFLNVHFYSDKEHYQFSSGRLGKLSQLISLLKIKNFDSNEKINLIKFVSKISKITTQDIVGQTTNEFLKNHNQSDKITKYFWEPIILATMNISPLEGSAEVFLSILKEAIFSNKKNQKLVFSTVPLTDLLLPIEQFKSQNLHFKKSTMITGMLSTDNQWEITTKDSEKYKFDYIILALPPKHCSKLLAELPDTYSQINNLFNFSRKTEYSPILSVYLWTENDFLEGEFAGLIDTEFHWIFKEKSPKNRFALTKSNAEKLISNSRKDLLEILCRDLEKIFPKFDRSKILHSQIIFEKQATIKITPEIELLRPTNKLTDTLYIAGDWTSTQLPATIESASKSGQMTARLIIENIRKSN